MCIQERHRRSCCRVRISFAEKNKSAPLLLHSATVGAKRMSTGHRAPAGGFVSVGDWTPTETNLLNSSLIEVRVLLR